MFAVSARIKYGKASYMCNKYILTLPEVHYVHLVYNIRNNDTWQDTGRRVLTTTNYNNMFSAYPIYGPCHNKSQLTFRQYPGINITPTM